jgi:hypothetical protein
LILQDAQERDQTWTSVLPPRELTLFLETLEKLSAHSRKLLHEEEQLAPGSGTVKETARWLNEEAIIKDDPPLLLEADQAKQLYDLLGKILGQR